MALRGGKFLNNSVKMYRAVSRVHFWVYNESVTELISLRYL